MTREQTRQEYFNLLRMEELTGNCKIALCMGLIAIEHIRLTQIQIETANELIQHMEVNR